MRRALALLSLGLTACQPNASPESAPTAGSSKAAAEVVEPTGLRYLGGQVDGDFARATQPRDLVFPRDHGSHDEFRSEWWYFTGNVEDASGRQFGFELTFFRIGLAPRADVSRASAWATEQVWMAHFAITDVRNRRLLAAERLARGALGLAGATASPFRVWVEDWSVHGEADSQSATMTLQARDEKMSMSLELQAGKPVAIHGDRGLDTKGPEPGNASYYYSFPRLAVRGAIDVDGRSSDVSGGAWMDREWGTSALSAGVVGWEWFGLQLSDGREVMLYRLRQADGAASAYSGGSLIDVDGTTTRLRRTDVDLEPTEYWTSERTHVRYPVAWRLAVPTKALVLTIGPVLRDQEINLSVRYWEGAVRLTGRDRESEVTGEGYLELAGY
jgi:predicted secreted hydrolase